MDPEKLQERLIAKGTEKARTMAYASTTDRLRKQVRAGFMVTFIGRGETVGKSEQMAIIEPEYIEACERAEKAEEEAGVAAVEYQAAISWWETWRTLQATRRAEMTLR